LATQARASIFARAHAAISARARACANFRSGILSADFFDFAVFAVIIPIPAKNLASLAFSATQLAHTT
jgi:hypothetical protein